MRKAAILFASALASCVQSGPAPTPDPSAIAAAVASALASERAAASASAARAATPSPSPVPTTTATPPVPVPAPTAAPASVSPTPAPATPAPATPTTPAPTIALTAPPSPTVALPTLSVAPTATPGPSFPPGVDPARTGVSGKVTTYLSTTTKVAAAGVPVRIIDWRGPGDSRPWSVYGAAITGGDGAFSITGVPPGTEYAVDINRNFDPSPSGRTTYCDGETAASYTRSPIVANTIVGVPEFTVSRCLGLSPANGATVPAGPLTVSWTALSGANVFCVTLVDVTAGTTLTTAAAACGATQSSPPMYVEVRGTSWTTPGLVSGHHYFLTVSAFDRTEFSVNNPKLGYGLSQDFAVR